MGFPGAKDGLVCETRPHIHRSRACIPLMEDVAEGCVSQSGRASSCETLLDRATSAMASVNSALAKTRSRTNVTIRPTSGVSISTSSYRTRSAASFTGRIAGACFVGRPARMRLSRIGAIFRNANSIGSDTRGHPPRPRSEFPISECDVSESSRASRRFEVSFGASHGVKQACLDSNPDRRTLFRQSLG